MGNGKFNFSFLVFLLIAIFYSCNTTSDISGNVAYSKFTDTLFVKGKDVLSFFDLSKKDSDQYLFLYRPKNSRIAVVDLNQNKETGSFKIPKENTADSGIGGLRSFFYENKDSVFLLYQYQLSIIDTLLNYKFIKNNINGSGSEDWPPVVYSNFGRVFPVYYDSKRKELLIRQHCGTCGNDTSFFRTNIVAAYNFKKDTFVDLGVPFPDKYKKNYFGDALYPFREVKGDSLIFTFNADPYITILNRATNTITKVLSRSKFQKEEIEPLDIQFIGDINKRSDHLIESPLYMKIIYDPFRNLYYRFYLDGKPLKNEDGTYNTFGDKDLIIMVLDSRFNTISEINLGKGYLWNYSFVGKRGLYILQDTKASYTFESDWNEQKLIFDIIRVGNN